MNRNYSYENTFYKAAINNEKGYRLLMRFRCLFYLKCNVTSHKMDRIGSKLNLFCRKDPGKSLKNIGKISCRRFNFNFKIMRFSKKCLTFYFMDIPLRKLSPNGPLPTKLSSVPKGLGKPE